MIRPKYPIYIISKGRSDICLTAKFMERDGIDYRLVVEPQEFEDYAKHFPKKKILQLPFSNLGQGGIPARNWVWQHAKKTGAYRHWIFDDNIKDTKYYWGKRRSYCDSNIAIAQVEEFVDRYENIAIAGMNYDTFVFSQFKPYLTNVRVYSNLLIRNDIPFEWRGRYNEDTDLCLQVLSNGWATVLFNAFMIQKMPTMTMKGGNTDSLYQGDGRLEMANSLKRQWPYVVETKRRFNRPQHVVKKAWQQFDTPLIRRNDIDWDEINKKNFKLKLVNREETKSEYLRKVVERYNGDQRQTTETD